MSRDFRHDTEAEPNMRTPAEAGGLVDVTQPLDDLHVGSDGACDWSDIANALDEVRRLHATALEAKEAELARWKEAFVEQAKMLKTSTDAGQEALATLTAERAVHAETKRERDAAMVSYTKSWNQRDAQRRRAEAAEARLAEALKALEEIGNGCDGRIDKDALPCRIARHALTGGKANG